MRELVGHVRKEHLTDLDGQMKDGDNISYQRAQSNTTFFYKSKQLSVYSWLVFVVMDLQPFYAVENSVL